MAKNPIKTKKVTHSLWKSLSNDTRKRALQYVLGPNFRDYMVEDSLNKDFIFWEVLVSMVRIVDQPDFGYKLFINASFYIN